MEIISLIISTIITRATARVFFHLFENRHSQIEMGEVIFAFAALNSRSTAWVFAHQLAFRFRAFRFMALPIAIRLLTNSFANGFRRLFLIIFSIIKKNSNEILKKLGNESRNVEVCKSLRISDSLQPRRLCPDKGSGNQVSRISRHIPHSLVLGMMYGISEAHKRAHKLHRNEDHRISMNIEDGTRWIAARSSLSNKEIGLLK